MEIEKLIGLLFKNEEFKEHLSSSIKITRPLELDHIANVYKIRSKNALQNKKDEISKQMDCLVNNLEIHKDKYDSVIGITISLSSKTFIFYVDNDFEHIFGMISG